MEGVNTTERKIDSARLPAGITIADAISLRDALKAAHWNNDLFITGELSRVFNNPPYPPLVTNFYKSAAKIQLNKEDIHSLADESADSLEIYGRARRDALTVSAENLKAKRALISLATASDRLGLQPWIKQEILGSILGDNLNASLENLGLISAHTYFTGQSGSVSFLYNDTTRHFYFGDLAKSDIPAVNKLSKQAFLAFLTARDPHIADKLRQLGEECLVSTTLSSLMIADTQLSTTLPNASKTETAKKAFYQQFAYPVQSRDLAVPAQELEELISTNLADEADQDMMKARMQAASAAMFHTLKQENRPYETYLSQIYKALDNVTEPLELASGVNDLAEINHWSREHRDNLPAEWVPTLDYISRIQDPSTLVKHLASLQKILASSNAHNLSEALLSLVLRPVTEISTQQMIDAVTEDQLQNGLRLENGSIALTTQNNDTFLARDDVGKVNGQSIRALLANSASAKEPDFVAKIKESLGIESNDFAAGIHQQFFQLTDKLFTGRLLDAANINMAQQPISLDFSLKNGKVNIEVRAQLVSLQSMPTIKNPMPALTELDAEYHYSASFNEQTKAYEVSSPLRITGQDAGLVQALMTAHPVSPEKIQLIIELARAVQTLQTAANANPSTRINCEALKMELQEWLSEYANKPAEARYVYGLSDKLKEIEAHYFDPNKNLLVDITAARQVLAKFSATIDALSPVGQAKQILQQAKGLKPAEQRKKRHAAADLLVKEIKQANPASVSRTLSDYQTALSSDPSFEAMVKPSGVSRYHAIIEGKHVSATASHNSIMQAAKSQVKAADKAGTVLSGSQKALLELERKKPWASWKFWGVVAIGLLAGAALGVITGGAILPLIAPVAITAITAPSVGAGILAIASAVMGYFAFRTPKQAAEKLSKTSTSANPSKPVEAAKASASAPTPMKEASQPIVENPTAAAGTGLETGMPRALSATALAVFDATQRQVSSSKDSGHSPER